MILYLEERRKSKKSLIMRIAGIYDSEFNSSKVPESLWDSAKDLFNTKKVQENPSLWGVVCV